MNSLAIDAKFLAKEYSGIPVLKNISFQVSKDSIHGFLGPNGAGKSTTFKIISGLIPNLKGSVEIFGNPIENVQNSLQKIIGYLPETPPLYEHMKVLEFMNFIFQIYGTDQKNRKSCVRDAIEKCGLVEVQNKFIGQLSKGYKQRTGIAMAIVHQPKLLILDEPFVGLDPDSMEEMRKLLKELKQEHTIIFSSHQLDEVKRLCSELTLIKSGETLFNGSLKDFQSDDERDSYRVVPLTFDHSLVEKIRERLEARNILVESDQENKGIRFDVKRSSQSKEVVARFFVENQIPIMHFSNENNDLVDSFQRRVQ